MKRWQVSSSLWKKLQPLAADMRQDPTPAERELWKHIRRGKLGVKFRRQHAIERFIADFYCAEARLIIEVDGEIHQHTNEHDQIRQEFLEAMGYRVLRFTNDEVLAHPKGVTKQIWLALQTT